MINKEELQFLLSELDPEDDKETWDKKVDKIKDALEIEHEFDYEKISPSQLKETLVKIVDLASKMEGFADGGSPEVITEIVNKQRERYKDFMNNKDSNGCFRRVDPDACAKDYSEKLRKKYKDKKGA